MHVRMLQLEYTLAWRANAAWFDRTTRFAEHALRKPQCKSLFADAGWTVHEQRPGQLSARKRGRQSTAFGFVSD
jgi:hypothetical protein